MAIRINRNDVTWVSDYSKRDGINSSTSLTGIDSAAQQLYGGQADLRVFVPSAVVEQDNLSKQFSIVPVPANMVASTRALPKEQYIAVAYPMSSKPLTRGANMLASVQMNITTHFSNEVSLQDTTTPQEFGQVNVLPFVGFLNETAASAGVVGITNISNTMDDWTLLPYEADREFSSVPQTITDSTGNTRSSREHVDVETKVDTRFILTANEKSVNPLMVGFIIVNNSTSFDVDLLGLDSSIKAYLWDEDIDVHDQSIL